jgi:hypothetical protein
MNWSTLEQAWTSSGLWGLTYQDIAQEVLLRLLNASPFRCFCCHVPLVRSYISILLSPKFRERCKVAITKRKRLGTAISLAFIDPQRTSRRRQRIFHLPMPPRLACAASVLASSSRATSGLRTCHSRALSSYSESPLLSTRFRTRLRSRGAHGNSFSPGDWQRVSVTFGNTWQGLLIGSSGPSTLLMYLERTLIKSLAYPRVRLPRTSRRPTSR